MKTIKIYDGEKEIFSGNCYVNTVIFKGRIYDDIKEISQNGIKFSLRLSNGKNEESSAWNKPTFANCVAFGDLADKIKKSYSQHDEIFLIAKYTSRKQNDIYYKNFVIRDLVSNKEAEKYDQQKLEKLIETADLPF